MLWKEALPSLAACELHQRLGHSQPHRAPLGSSSGIGFVHDRMSSIACGVSPSVARTPSGYACCGSSAEAPCLLRQGAIQAVQVEIQAARSEAASPDMGPNKSAGGQAGESEPSRRGCSPAPTATSRCITRPGRQPSGAVGGGVALMGPNESALASRRIGTTPRSVVVAPLSWVATPCLPPLGVLLWPYLSSNWPACLDSPVMSALRIDSWAVYAT